MIKQFVKSSPFARAVKSLKAPRVKESYFATCERDDAGHCLPKGEQGAKKPKDKPKKEERETTPSQSSVKNKLSEIKAKVSWVPSHTGTLSSYTPPGTNKYSTEVRRDITRQIMEKGLAVKDAALHLTQLDDGITKENFINSITKGDSAKAVKDYADIPLFDLHVLGGIKVIQGKHPNEGVCNMESRDVTFGTESATGTPRHELGHALHAFYGAYDKNFFNDAINAHYAEVMKKVKANPVAGKQTHEWYEENYGIIGSRGLDNAKEDFAEHYRGYHKAIWQDQNEGGGGKMLERYRKLHPEMAALFDAHYTSALLGIDPSKLGNGKSKEGQPCGPGETPEQTGCVPQKDEQKPGDKYKIDYNHEENMYEIKTSQGEVVDTHTLFSDAQKVKAKLENMFDKGEKKETSGWEVLTMPDGKFGVYDDEGNLSQTFETEWAANYKKDQQNELLKQDEIEKEKLDEPQKPFKYWVAQANDGTWKIMQDEGGGFGSTFSGGYATEEDAKKVAEAQEYGWQEKQNLKEGKQGQATVVEEGTEQFYIVDADGNKISGVFSYQSSAMETAAEWNAFKEANPSISIIKDPSAAGSYTIMDGNKVVGQGAWFKDSLKTAQQYVDDKPYKKEPPVRPDEATPKKNKQGYYDLENQVAGYANMSIVKNPGDTVYDVIDNATGYIIAAGLDTSIEADAIAWKKLNEQVNETGSIKVGKYQIDKNSEGGKYQIVDTDTGEVIWGSFQSQSPAGAFQVIKQHMTDDAINSPAPQDIGTPVPKTQTADTSFWDDALTASHVAANKISAMESAAAKGDWEQLQKWQPDFPTNTQNKYQQAIVNSWQNLMAKKAAEDKPVDVSKWEKVGGQLGSNPGGKYKDENGKEWYVKFAKSEDHARNEVLAAKLYELAGAPVTEYHLADTKEHQEGGAGLGTATAWAEHGDHFEPSGEFDKDAAVANFGVHAWLGNWDAVGLNYDNQQWVKVPDSKQQKLLTVDTGGAMLYRAQGEPKAFTKNVSEWDSLRDPKTNPQSAAVFGQMTPEQLQKAAAKVAQVSDAAIDALVDKYATDSKKFSLKEILKARRDAIAAFGNFPGTAPSQETPAPQASVSPAMPPPPVFGSGQSGVAQSYNQKVAKINQLASKGAVSALEAMKLPQSKGPWQSKLTKYKQDVLTALKQGGKPSAAQAAQAAVAQSAKPIKVDPSKFPKDPVFESKNAANVAMNTAAVGKLKQLAAAGDLPALQAMPVPASPKLQGWKNDLAQSLHQQLNPPKPPKPYSGQLADLSKKHSKVFKNRAEAVAAKAQFVAKYVLTEEPGIPPESMPKVKFKLDGKRRITDAAEQAKHDAAWKAMTSSERSQILQYTGPGSSYNEALRSGNVGSDLHATAVAIGKTLLKHAVEMTPGTYVERHIGLTAGQKEMLQHSVGKVLQDFGFGSTSLDKKVSSDTVLRLTAAPGAKGLYIGDHSSYVTEREYLLPPGYRLLLTGAEGNYIDALILATEPEQCC